MIELYLAVWFQCWSTVTFHNDPYGYQAEGWKVRNCQEKEMVTKSTIGWESDVKFHPINFYYCEFYEHKFEKLKPCIEETTSEKIWSIITYDTEACPMEECFFCKKKRKKKVTEEWEYESPKNGLIDDGSNFNPLRYLKGQTQE